jgi:class 3 adenylate cyclase
MPQLRTTVLMKTDIVGSTPQFRALLASDLQAVLSDHRAMLAGLAAEEGGRILKSTGDGYWLEFPSATGAARAAIAMHEALRLAQPNKGDDRLSMRIIIGLGDTATQDGELAGDVLALVARIEVITPPDEIYLTTAACLALTQSEIRTGIVDRFSLKGFTEPIQVYRVEQRHRTRIFTDSWILCSDLRGFGRLTQVATVGSIERVLDTLETLTRAAASEFSGTVRFSAGDSYCVTFPDASSATSAASGLSRTWAEASREHKFDCAINLCLHCGSFNAFRSFLYGDGITNALRALEAAVRLVGGNEGNIFATGSVRDNLQGSPWHTRLQPLALELALAPELKVFRLEPE